MQHECTYDQVKPEEQASVVNGLQCVTVTQHPACLCGQVQPTRGSRIRAAHHRILRSTIPAAVSDPLAGVVARELVDRASPVPWAGRASALARRHDVLHVRGAIEDLARSGIVDIEERGSPAWEPYAIHIRDPARLAEVAHPGDDQRLREIRAWAAEKLEGRSEQAAQDALEFIASPEAMAWPTPALQGLAFVAAHSGEPDVLINQASAQWLGDAKALRRHASRIQAVLGPYDDFGLLSSEHLVLVGGQGTLEMGDQLLDVQRIGPIIGLSRQRILQATEAEGSPTVFTENRAVFDAVAHGLVTDIVGALAIFTNGNPGPAVRHLAKVAKGPIFVWCDMDAEGVAFYRAIHASNNHAKPYRMSVDEFEAAHHRKPLDKPGKRKALERELAVGGPLQELLDVIEATQAWVEQEIQL